MQALCIWCSVLRMAVRSNPLRWDTQTGLIQESQLKELTPTMPVIFIKAIPVDKQDTKNVYECPVYKTRTRGPTYVWTFNLKTKEKPAKWVIAGVCLLLSDWVGFSSTCSTGHTYTYYNIADSYITLEQFYHVHAYIPIYIYSHVCTCMYVCIYESTCMYVHVLHVSVYLSIYLLLNLYIYLSINHLRSYIHTYLICCYIRTCQPISVCHLTHTKIFDWTVSCHNVVSTTCIDMFQSSVRSSSGWRQYVNRDMYYTQQVTVGV